MQHMSTHDKSAKAPTHSPLPHICAPVAIRIKKGDIQRLLWMMKLTVSTQVSIVLQSQLANL